MKPMTADQLSRKRGPKPKYTEEERIEFLQAVASNEALSVEEVCERRGVSRSVGYQWINAEKKKLGAEITSLDPQDQPAQACKHGQSEGIVPAEAKETEEK